MCSTRGSCCFLPGLQFITGGQRGCWYQSFLQWNPPPPSSCDLCGVTVVHNSQKPSDGPFLYKMKTQHMYTQLNKWTHAVSHVHLPLPFLSVQPGWAMCRLSAATTTLQTVRLNLYCRAGAATYTSGFKTTAASSGASALLSEVASALLTQHSWVSTWSCPRMSVLIPLTCSV